MQDLDAVLAAELEAWPGQAGLAVIGPEGVLGRAGDLAAVWPWASVTKLVSALTVLRGVADGVVSLDDAAGPPGATLRHLLAHASGLDFGSQQVLAEPGRRRIYSNTGIEVAAAFLAERAGQPFPELVERAVLLPLSMTRTSLTGSSAHGASGPVQDLAQLAHELLVPHVFDADLIATATTETFPGLTGVLPGFGRQDPNPWGLGFEVRGHKQPHWTSPHGSPRTFGHFGQSGAFLWVDPDAEVACVSAGDTPFGAWAAERWPLLAAAVLEQV